MYAFQSSTGSVPSSLAPSRIAVVSLTMKFFAPPRSTPPSTTSQSTLGTYFFSAAISMGLLVSLTLRRRSSVHATCAILFSSAITRCADCAGFASPVSSKIFVT